MLRFIAIAVALCCLPAFTQDIAAGKRLFDSQCALCHGIGGSGGRGPAFTGGKLKHAETDKELAQFIASGSDEMPAFWFLPEKTLSDVAAYVRSLNASAASTPITGDPARGKALFASNGCLKCHIVNGEGAAYGPELTAIGVHRSPAYLRESILNPNAAVPDGFVFSRAVDRSGRTISGVRVNEDSFTIQLRDSDGHFHSLRKADLTALHKDATSPMPAYRLPDSQIDDLIAYLIHPSATEPEPRSEASGPASNPGNWTTYSGNYAAHRFSPLTQITAANVQNLHPIWIYQLDERGEFEVSPIVVDGTMYITEPPGTVSALDARTGRRLWSYRRELPKDLRTLGFGRVNRGVAVLGDTVYAGTLDAHLVALDARSGALRWDAPVADNKLGHCITAAPLAIGDKIIVGISGGETGIRGFLDAYDARTGKRLWRLWTIPAAGEPGTETWARESWKTGGGPTWVTGSYDPDLNLIYWGTGNPGPDWNGDARAGDNLYTCSLLAVDATTGKLKWHFQFTPHDVHDWDSTEIPVLLDAEVRGRPRKLVAMANRNAFYYLIDRATGEFLLGTPYAKQTWAKGLDDSGRPMLIPGMEPSEQGTLVYPSLQGATNWFSPSYSPATKLFYVAVREMGSFYYKTEAEFKPGTFFGGGGERALNGDKAYGAIRALDASNGKLKWEFKLQSPPWAGVMATAGGLVFGGSNEGNFYALDAATGKPLWDFQTGGGISANPVSFNVDGQQRVAIAAGRALFVFGL